MQQQAGSGVGLATALRPGNTLLPAQTASAVGTVMPMWDPAIDGWSHARILRIIEFYNQDFGIVLADDLATRKSKVRDWLRM